MHSHGRTSQYAGFSMGDDRIKREEIPELFGLSYRKCNEQKIFKRIRKFKDKGVYSKVDAIILKDKMI